MFMCFLHLKTELCYVCNFFVSSLWLLKWENLCMHPAWKESLSRGSTAALQVCWHDISLLSHPLLTTLQQCRKFNMMCLARYFLWVKQGWAGIFCNKFIYVPFEVVTGLQPVLQYHSFVVFFFLFTPTSRRTKWKRKRKGNYFAINKLIRVSMRKLSLN
jgi:hypothetical protein